MAVLDTSLMTLCQGLRRSQLLDDPDRRGHLVESAVVAYLLRRSNAEGFEVNWWRDRDNREVDFVVVSGDQPHRHRGQKRASASPGRVPLSHKSGANGAIRRHVMDCQHVIRSRRAADVYLLKFGANSSRRMNSFGFVSCNALLCTQPLHITAASRGAAVSVRCSKSSAREKFNSRVSFVYRLSGILRQSGVDSRNAVGT